MTGHTIEMAYPHNTMLIFLGLASFVNASVFDKNFLIRIEDVTKINKDLTSTNQKLNETIVRQENLISNFSDTIETLQATVAAMEKGKLPLGPLVHRYPKLADLARSVQTLQT